MACAGSIGILAYGSLMGEPSPEISRVLVRRIPTMTPFPVEYARLSGTRGGAPTVCPHSAGSSVKAEVLVLSDSVPLEEAKNLLWRRETRNEASERTYRESYARNAVVVRDQPGFCGLAHVLYTDFNPDGKSAATDPRALAEAAIRSVAAAANGRDGITYLMGLINAGVQTALTPGYVGQILALTGTNNLAEALEVLRTGQKRDVQDGQS